MKRKCLSVRGEIPRAVGGQVTVFISLVMMCMFAVFCVLVESARTAGARWYLQMAADSAMDSVFSQYHRQLWDSYRLLFAEYSDEGEIQADFERFLTPYLEAENWYPMALEETRVQEIARAVDEEGIYLEKEILDYMKYGVWDLDFELDTEELLQSCGKEAEAVKEIAGSYRGHANEAIKLERSLEAISENLAEEEQIKARGLSRLNDYDGSGFRSEAKDLIRKLKKMPGLVDTYRKRADELQKGLLKSREESRPHHEQCSDSVNQMLEAEIQEYEAYVSLDGERRQEIESLEAWSAQKISQIEEIIEESREVERVIEEWDSGDDEDEEEEEPDLDALWSPVIHHFEQVEIRKLSFRHGVKDKEKEGWLKQVEQMYRSGLLAMLVPDGAEVSDRRVNLSETPSHTETGADGGRTASLTDHLLVNAYCGEFLQCFCDRDEKEHALDYEMEYLIGGNEGDEENLSSAVHRLLAIREGLNLIYILSDASMRAEARSLALMVTGLAAVTPLVFIVTFFIMSVWALGEAMMDVRGLLDQRKVPVLKQASDWKLDLDSLMEMGRSREVPEGGSERGLSYLSWLKILLFLNPVVRQEYRLMDVIQLNLRLGQDSFRMRRGVYSLGLKGKLCGKHVFYSLRFVENLLGQQDFQYPMEVQTERIY